MSLKQKLTRNISNIPGWRTKRKIVVIESDDWGSIRMPSKEVYQKLLKNGIRVDKSKFNSLDCLENKNDLTNLCNILSTLKDRSGNHPAFTCNVVMGNPDFEKIKTNNFENYHFEHFYKSYQKYNGEDLKQYWEDAIVGNLLKPQYHAREHLNSHLWMNDLRAFYPETCKAFEYNFFGLKTKTSSPNQNHYLAAYRADNLKELKIIEEILKDGLMLFEKTFGFKSKTFIACNYTWPLQIEKYLANYGVKILQGQRGHIVPKPENGANSIKYHFTGQKSQYNQIYTVRNVLFEPYENPDKDWVDSAMSEVSNAFFWRKPAIISTHRINFVSGMSVDHRDKNLKSLVELLKQIIHKWPDIEFFNSEQLSKLF